MGQEDGAAAEATGSEGAENVAAVEGGDTGAGTDLISETGGESADGSLIDDGQAPAEGGEGAGDDKKEAAKEGEPEFAPESGYSEFGQTEGVAYTTDDLSEAGGIFAELNGGKGISQEDAQKLIDFASQRVTRDASALSDAKANMESSWKKEIAADPELGGDNFGRSKAVVTAAVHPEHGVAGANALLAEARKVGLASWPPLFRFLHGLGKGISEDGNEDGNSAAGGKADFRTFYENPVNDAGDSA